MRSSPHLTLVPDDLPADPRDPSLRRLIRQRGFIDGQAVGYLEGFADANALKPPIVRAAEWLCRVRWDRIVPIGLSAALSTYLLICGARSVWSAFQ